MKIFNKKVKIQTEYFLIIPFLLPLLYLIGNYTIDNDFWFTINQGRYVINNSFPYTVISTIHSGLSFIYQSWGTGTLYYLIYKYLGNIGIIIFATLIIEAIIYFFYKLCLLVSNNNKISILLSILFSMLLYPFLTIRPQLFTMLNLVLILYFIESYIKKNRIKYLIPIPFIYLLQVNMHGVYYVPLLIFIVPHLINSFKFKIKGIESDGYNKKPLFITYLISILVGFVNPNTYKMFIYGFKSYGNSSLSKGIEELNAISFDNNLGKVCLLVLFVTYFIYFFRKNKLPIRYYLLLFGTTIVALDAYKSFYFFMICSLFPIAYIYKEKKEYKNDKKVIITSLLTILLMPILVFSTINVNKPYNYDIANYLDENNDIDNPKLYTSFYDGSYLEYRGYNCYIDPRADVFIKTNNLKEDIMIEYFDLQNGKLSYNEFLNKYNFDYLIIEKEHDILYFNFINYDVHNYQKVYENTTHEIWKKV